MAKPSDVYRTKDAKPNSETLIKPGELVDLIEVTPLTLTDRRIYNQLLENAWDDIDRPVEHMVSKAQLRGSHNSNDRVGESIERLMAAIVRVETKRNGKPHIERVQLLGGNTEGLSRDGLLYYEIPSRLRTIIKDSTVFARLQREIMFALSSKYALTLYEMVQKRGNLKFKSSERFTLDALRGILGVPKGKLTSWSNLNLRAIKPAVAEVSELSDYIVTIDPIKTGRSVTHVELKWWRKDAQGVQASEREMQFSKVGRKVRRAGGGEIISERPGQPLRPRPAILDSKGTPLRSETYETARLRFSGYDIYHVEGVWRDWAAQRDAPKDPDRAYLAFFATFAERNPLS